MLTHDILFVTETIMLVSFASSTQIKECSRCPFWKQDQKLVLVHKHTFIFLLICAQHNIVYIFLSASVKVWTCFGAPDEIALTLVGVQKLTVPHDFVIDVILTGRYMLTS